MAVHEGYQFTKILIVTRIFKGIWTYPDNRHILYCLVQPGLKRKQGFRITAYAVHCRRTGCPQPGMPLCNGTFNAGAPGPEWSSTPSLRYKD